MGYLKSLFCKALASPYVRNTAVLASGTGIAQLIRIGSSPITRKLYSPEEYGLFALVLSLSAICGSIAMGRYEMAIMLPKEEKKSIDLCWLSFFLSVGFSGLLMAFVILYSSSIADWLENPKIEPWLFLVPVLVFGNSTYRILYNFNNRIQNYKDISKTQLYQAIGLTTISIGLGLALKDSVLGLMIAGTISTFLGISLLKQKFFQKTSFAAVRKQDLKTVAIEQSKFPKFSVWAGLANTLSAQLLDVFIGITFTISMLGQYSLTKMVCGLPSSVMGAALSQVFYQRIVQCKNSNGDCLATFRANLIYLALFSAALYASIFFLAKPVIHYVFGPRWAPAAEFTQLLVPFYAIRFVSSAFGTTTSAFERQELTLAVNLQLLFSLLAVIGAKHYFELSLRASLITYAAIFSLNYLMFLVIYYRIIWRYQRGQLEVQL